MVQFLSIIFFSWISSIFVGFFKSSRFFVSPCIKNPRHKFNTKKTGIRIRSIQHYQNFIWLSLYYSNCVSVYEQFCMIYNACNPSAKLHGFQHKHSSTGVFKLHTFLCNVECVKQLLQTHSPKSEHVQGVLRL